MLEARSVTSKVILQLVTTVLIIPFAVPLIVMFSGSFAGQGWGNYQAVFRVPNLLGYFRNSILIAAATVAIVYVLTMMAAFGFSKLRIRSKEVFFWMMMAALTLPEVVLLTPLFTTVAKIGISGTLWSVILPISALQVPFTVLLTRTYVNGIPDALFEAARIDGASTWRCFIHILVPLAKPIAVAVIVFVMINAWNSYLLPLVFLTGDHAGVVTLLPQHFQGQYNDDQTKVLAGAVITALPEVVAYISLQKYFERGMAAGALK
jgi:ABC-type glycerol-3-phosphate transport system permease component